MIRNDWFRQSARAASTGVFLLAFSLSIHAVSGQTPQTDLGASPDAVMKPSAPPTFVVAPSIALPSTPTSLVTGHLNSNGKLDLITADSAAGTITVYPGSGDGAFAAPRTYAAGSEPGALTLCDVNGDGKVDVILTNESAQTISIFRGNGDTTLGIRQVIPLGFSPSMLAVADFTGDGRNDIAVAGTSGTTLAILQNTGSGLTTRPINFALSAHPNAIVTGDFNRDGHPDIALANADGTVSILLGQGNGQFAAISQFAPGIGALSSIAVGDLNRDGLDDLAIASSTQNQTAVLLGQGIGRFSFSSAYAVGNGPVSVKIIDTDSDGNPDVVVLNRDSNTFTVLPGVGDGSLRPAMHFVVGNAPVGLAVGDFYGSGHLDITTVNSLSKTLSVPNGNGDATFIASRAYMAGAQPVAIAAGDLRGTGRSDLVVANYCPADTSCGDKGSAAVLLSDTTGVYHLASTYVMGTGSVSIAVLDVNGDSKPDLLSLNRVDRSIAIRLGEGDGSFGPLNTIPLSNAPIAFTTADFNGDHVPDLVVVGDCGAAHCIDPGSAAVLLGAGDGTFHLASTYAVGYTPVSVTAGATRSGAPADFLVANRCGQDASCTSGATASLYLGNGNGSFTAAQDVTFDKAPSAVAFASFRGNGILDLLVARPGDDSLAVLPGKGDGTFLSPGVYAVGTSPGAIAVADFNADGIPDVAVANTGDSTVSVLYGSSTGILKSATPLVVGGSPHSITAIPANSGARPALATASGSISGSVPNAAVTVVSSVLPHAAGATAPSDNVLTSSAHTSTVNQSVTLTATVTGASGTPTGNVVFFNGATALPDCAGATGLALDGTGVASCSTAVLPAGTLSISANYLGDSTYASLTSNTLTQTVSALPVTVTLSPSPASPSTVNTAVTFTASLSGTFTPTVPSGTMTFTLNGTTLAACSGTVSSAGVGICQIADIPTGTSSTIKANYSGDSNFTAASDATTTYEIKAAAPTMTINASPGSTVSVGVPVTFTATLSGVPFTPIAPNGTVAWQLNGSPYPGCTAVPITGSQTAVCAMSGLLVPADTITATYSGDSNFVVSSAAQFTESVTQTGQTVQLTTSQSPSTVNHPVTLTAVVPAPGGQSGKPFPTGNVTFTSGATTLCGGPMVLSTPALPLSPVNQPTAICNTAFASANTYSITATYSGDSNFQAGTPGSITQTIDAGPTTTSLAASGSAPVNQPVTFTATVKPNDTGAAIPQGTVSFQVTGSTPPGTCASGVTLNNGAAPACTYTFPSAGTFNVIATFHPTDANFSTSSSPALPVGIGAGAITINLSSNVNPSAVNQSVTFTASFGTITGTQPNGTMTFTDTFTHTTLCAPAVVNGAVTTCTVALTSAGPHTVEAAFTSADGNFGNGTSNIVTQTVNATGITTTLVSATPTATVNQLVTFTATLAPATGGTTNPTGNVAFTATSAAAGSIVLCTNPVTTSGITTTATCTVPMPAADTYSVTAAYAGDKNFAQSNSSAITQVVNATNVSVTVNSSETAPVVNQPITFTATLIPAVTGPSTPRGTVTFKATNTTLGGGPVTLCTSNVNSAATPTATCTAPLQASGSYTIFATYNGDTDFNANTSSALAQAVGKAGVTVDLAAPSAAAINQPVSYTATIVPAVTGAAVPGGTITFNDNVTGTLLCGTQSVSGSSSGNASASCAVTFLSAATHTITATYSGDSNYSAGSPASSSITISRAGTTLTITPTSPSITATAPITFAAAITPAHNIANGSVPTGTVDFLSTDLTLNACHELQVARQSDGTFAAICQLANGFPHTASLPGQIGITATYNGDANFVSSTSTLNEMVADFNIKFAMTAAPLPPPAYPSRSSDSAGLFLTQGYTNTTDPFNPATMIVTVSTSGAYAGPLNLACQMKDSSGNKVTDPSCSVSPTSQVVSAGTQYTIAVNASATAPIGKYTISLTAVDSAIATLTQSAGPGTIHILAHNGPLTLAAGATGGESVQFNTASAPSNSSLTQLSCPEIWDTLNKVFYDNVATPQIVCSGPSSTPITGNNTSVVLTVIASSQTAQLARTSTLQLAGVFGLPVLALLGWFGAKNSRRRDLFRLMLLSLVVLGIASFSGCGGGTVTYQKPATLVGIKPGSYLVQVVAKDGSGNLYYTTVPLTIAN